MREYTANDFNYGHILNKPPGVICAYKARWEKCPRCGGEFWKDTGAKKRCAACQEIHTRERLAAANEKLKQRRAAARKAKLI